MRTGNTRSRLFPVLLALLASPVAAQVLPPPIVHWIGPEPSCDYATIQEALGEVFDCGPSLCPPGRHELRLSANYVHGGPIEVSRSFDLVGGYGGGCGTSTSGPRTVLDGAGSNESLIRVNPGSRTINNLFVNLMLEGTTPGPVAGGVIEMLPGDATLTLKSTVARDGEAAFGGAVYLAGNGNKLVLIDSFIQTSQAVQGGGIYCTQGGVIDFQSGRIEDNVAVLNGGGIHLENGCELDGRTPGVDRQIRRNALTDIQRGEGGGIYALASRIELGALYSLTQIESNVVPAFVQTGVGSNGLPTFDHYRYDEPGTNRGGGVHLQHSEASFINTWFRFNEAAEGGAIAAVGSSTLRVDRSSGPCVAGDTGETPHCSLFQENRARGGKDPEGDEGGDGAVLLAVHDAGLRPTVEIHRSLWTGNAAGCFDATEPDFEGECDLGGFTPNTYEFSTTNMLRADSTDRLVVAGNLISGNSIGDDEDCTRVTDCDKIGSYFSLSSDGTFSENTITGNLDADFLFLVIPENVLNNIIVDPAVDRGVFSSSEISSCNLSNFATELNLRTDSAPISNVDLDPLFLDPASGDYRLMAPDSPAIDRCDDAGGQITSTYDILGNPRPLNVAGLSNGPGQRDAGAFEALPAGFVDTTTDLVVDIRSALPKTAALSQAHDFFVEVTNAGRNEVGALTVHLDPGFGPLESLTGARAPDGMGGLVQIWDCVRSTFRCTYVGAGLDVGVSTTVITARVSYDFQGARTVTATVSMDDPALTELTPANNSDSDTVTVGPGADLKIEIVAIPPGRVAIGQAQSFTVAIHNNGPEVADGVSVELGAFGGEIEPVASLGSTDWTCDTATGICTLDRPLDVLANEPGGLPSLFTVAVSAPTPGVRALAGTVSATGGPGDPDRSNNYDQASFEVFADGLFANGFED